MSSFSRIYGIEKVTDECIFNEIASIWCKDNIIDKNKSIEEHDLYFKNLYENWQ